jgi:hypothetical protein
MLNYNHITRKGEQTMTKEEAIELMDSLRKEFVSFLGHMIEYEPAVLQMIQSEVLMSVLFSAFVNGYGISKDVDMKEFIDHTDAAPLTREVFTDGTIH